ncbi:MAG: sorbosone dehydrogenase family protein, partial [Planctomycetota bacterium]
MRFRSVLAVSVLTLGSIALAAPPFGIETRTPNLSAIIATVDAPTGGGWTTERVFPGLSFRAGTFLTHANDGTKRIFVGERRGVVTALAPVANPLTQTPVTKVFLDISSRVRSTSGNEEGLLSVAFHPRFRLNGHLFVCYTTGSKYLPTTTNTVRTRVSRFHLKAGSTATAVVDPALEEVLFEIPKRYFNHNGGQLAFGPDGYLYVGIGDGGSGGDPERNGQRLDTLKGKILRLDIDKGVPYGIPQ